MVSVYHGEPAWTPRNYESLAKEGFSENIWVYRCIMAIAQAGAAVDWLVYTDPSKKKEIESHKLLDLLYKPNEFMSKQEFFESVIAYLMLSGNSYMESNGPNQGPPMELFPLRPDRMKVIPDSKNFVSGYQYELNSLKYTWDVSKVGHIKLFHALNDMYGFSPIEVGAKGIDNDNAASSWNNALLNNGARPTGAMTTDSTLTDPQYDRLSDQINTKYKGAANAGRPMLLEGGLKWQEMGLSPRDMDFIESKKMSRVEICAAFGVPPEMVGDKEHATYSNYAEARQAFYMETVLPILDKVRDKLNAWLVPKFGEKLYLDYDKDSIEALQENTDEKAARIRADVLAGLLMVDEGRTAMGYEEVPGGAGKVFYIPGTAKVVDEKGTVLYAPAPPTAAPAATDPNKGEGEEGKKGFFLKTFNLETEEQKAAYWKAIDKRRATHEKAAVKLLQEHFEKERKVVLKAYENGGKYEQSLQDSKKELTKILTAIYVDVMEDFGKATFRQLKHDSTELELKLFPSFFNIFDKFVQRFIASTVAQKVVGITDVTIGKLKGLIQTGTSNGESIVQIAQRIDSLYLDQIIPHRSTVIARTEVIGASNAGNHHAAKQTGLTLEKEWISTRDDRTREHEKNDLFDHTKMDGVKVPMDEPFIVPGKKGDDSIEFPGDPKGQAANIIQCRCTHGFKRIKK